MDRMSVFYPAKNDAGYVQAVIVADDFSVYEGLGFVASIDDLKPTEEQPEKNTGGSKGSKKAADNGDDSDKG